MTTSTGPVWLDTTTGDVVTDEPEQGRLLVPAGVEITDDIRAAIDRASLDHAEPSEPAQVADAGDGSSDGDGDGDGSAAPPAPAKKAPAKKAPAKKAAPSS